MPDPYYAGGHRKVIGGVPCRMAFKPAKECWPSKTNNPFKKLSNDAIREGWGAKYLKD